MTRKRIAWVTGIIVLLLAAGVWLMAFRSARWVSAVSAAEMRETRESLNNPDRGFYLIHGIVISDGMDAVKTVQDSYAFDSGRRLSLLDVNLCAYAGGDITDAGLRAVSAVFEALPRDMRYLVRFVYDWDGKNMETEPVSRAIVERHMVQLAPVINANAERIYTLQGLFVGNWGEMNGTRYIGKEHWRALARTLAEATDDSILLSVRMPMQRRCVCGDGETAEAAPGVSARMGLFNDGMLGSYSDLGTYSASTEPVADYYAPWRPAEELEYVEELTRSVPNGGEAVCPEGGCSLAEAERYFRATHVSYLNDDYDRRLWDAWAEETVSGGVWDAADGKTYIREHLGYRFATQHARVRYDYLRNRLTVEADVQNVGFAPAYFPLQPQLLLLRDGKECARFPFDGDLAMLWGGTHETVCTLSVSVPLGDVAPGDYELALLPESGRGVILFANDTRMKSGAVIIGGITAK